MSPATLALTAAGGLAAALAVIQLLRACIQAGPPVKNGYQWLAVAASAWGAGILAQQLSGGLIGGLLPVRATDLVSIAALPALVIAAARLTGEFAGPARSRGTVADRGLLGAALFVIC